MCCRCFGLVLLVNKEMMMKAKSKVSTYVPFALKGKKMKSMRDSLTSKHAGNGKAKRKKRRG